MNKRVLDEALLNECKELNIDLNKVAVYLKKSVDSLTNEDLKRCIAQKKVAQLKQLENEGKPNA